MDSFLKSKPEMTGFIIKEGCLYAVLKSPSGETRLYDSQALAWLVSEARKSGALARNFENAHQVLTTANIC